MDERPPSRPTTPPRDPDALDETDPHAGDDADWEDAARAAEPTLELEPEPSPLRFWRGVLIGGLFSAVAWLVLAVALYALFRLLAG